MDQLQHIHRTTVYAELQNITAFSRHKINFISGTLVLTNKKYNII